MTRITAEIDYSVPSDAPYIIRRKFEGEENSGIVGDDIANLICDLLLFIRPNIARMEYKLAEVVLGFLDEADTDKGVDRDALDAFHKGASALITFWDEFDEELDKKMKLKGAKTDDTAG